MSNYYTKNRDELWQVSFSTTATTPASAGVNKFLYACPSISRSGQSVPFYKRLISQNLDATSSFSAKGVKFTRQGKGFATFVYYSPSLGRGVSFDCSGDVSNFPNFLYPLMSDSTAANNQALARLYQAIRGAQTQMSGAVFLGEMREAIHMLRHPVEGLRNGMRDYLDALSKRKRGRQSKSLLRRILGDTWLEYSFGWIPFINDIKDAQKAFQRVRNRTQSTRVRAYGSSELYGGHTISESIFNNYLVFGNTTRIKRKIEVFYTAGLADVTQGATDLQLATDSFGLNLREFVPTAWELLPWSFAVDYFTNAGAIISSFFTNTSSVRWLSKTIRSEARQENRGVFNMAKTGIAPGPVNVVEIGGVGQDWEYVYKSVDRARSGLQLPSFMVTMPSVDSLKWVNLVALGSQMKRLTPFY